MGRLIAKQVDSFRGPGALVDGDGLELRWWSDGRRSWRIRCRVRGLKGQLSETLGDYPDLSLAHARARGREIVLAARRGVHLPEHERAAAVKAAKVSALPKTVGDFLGQYLTEHVSKLIKHKQTKALLEDHVVPKIGKLALVNVRRADIVAMLDELAREKGLGPQLNRVLAQTRAAWNWGIEREIVDSNPTSGVKRRVAERPRQRTLSDAEVGKILRAAEDIGYPGGDFVRMLFWTAARRNEAMKLPRSEIGADGIWFLPAARNKAKRDHRIPLPIQALEMLRRKSSDFVFTADGQKVYAGDVTLKRRLDRLSGVKDWVLHDIRRTVRTGLSRQGVADPVAERIMNHAQAKLVATYNTHDYQVEMANGLQAWADHLDGVLAIEKGGNVVRLKAAG